MDGENGHLTEESFPIAVFPGQLRKVILAYHDSLKFPIDFTGVAMLYAASIAIGNTYEIEVKVGWKERAVIYAVLVGNASSTKSHPLKMALKPIFEIDKNLYNDFIDLQNKYDTYTSASKSQRENMESITKPHYQKHIISDITPEAIASVHQYNLRGLGLHKDELTGWFKNFNRYHKGSEQEFWIESWSSAPITIDRKTGAPVRVDLPFISIGGTIQTKLLPDLAKDGRVDNGFLPRLLFAMPDGLKKEYLNDSEINPAHIEYWKQIIERLFATPFNGYPKTIRLSKSAKQAHFRWNKTNTNAINATSDDYLKSLYGKLENNLFRIALILQRLEDAEMDRPTIEVTEDTFHKAHMLIEYFRIMGEKVYNYIGDNGVQLNTRSVVHHLHSLGTSQPVIASALKISQPRVSQILNE